MRGKKQKLRKPLLQLKKRDLKLKPRKQKDRESLKKLGWQRKQQSQLPQPQKQKD